MAKAFFLVVTTVIAWAQGGVVHEGEDSMQSREARWHADLDFLAEELPAKHIDFRKLMPRREFEREVQRIESEVTELSDAQVLFRLQRLIASLGIAHTRIGWPPGESELRRYPIQFHWFSDGLAIVATGPEHRNLLGAQVARIGDLTPAQAVLVLAPYVSYENGVWLRQQAAALLRNVELLQDLGVAEPDGRVRLSLVRPESDSFSVHIAPVSAAEPSEWTWAWEELDTPPVLRRHQRAFYWHENMSEARALYVQYNRCANVPGYPFSQFAADVLAASESNEVERIVIDLRYNGGGNSSVVKPLVHGLKSHSILKGSDHVFVIIGADTFSSGVFAAVELRNDLGATLVGEPTGGKPNSYGNTPSFRLPNSQAEVFYCTKNFRLIKGRDPQSLEPDVLASMSLGDFLAGRDPALEAALGSVSGGEPKR